MAAILKERRSALLKSTARNGIDFVEVDPAQTTLRVHFLNPVVLSGSPTVVTISGGDSVPTVDVPPVVPADWSQAGGRPVLTISLAAPGDFSLYTLRIRNDLLDPFFEASTFSFKVNCPTDLDCKTAPPECPPLPPERPQIDYTAKDFLSFRQALLDFSAQRYPQWQERSEADFGVMFTEALSALGDHLSYLQDRHYWEQFLESATQRRSLTRLARLVDYEPMPATSSSVLLQLDVKAGTTSIPPRLPFLARTAEGQAIVFETGQGLVSPGTGEHEDTAFEVDARWNRGLKPYIWDKSQACLARGATEMWIEGHGLGLHPGLVLCIDTPAVSSADAPVRELIHLIAVGLDVDELFPPGGPPTPLTHLVWAPSEALAHDHPLFWTDDELAARGGGDPLRTIVAGNLVPASHGRTLVQHFALPDADGKLPAGAPPGSALALVRTAANGMPQYLYTLPEAPLAWLRRAAAPAGHVEATPELVLEQLVPAAGQPWRWHRSLLTADWFETAFTLDRARYAPIAELPSGAVACEYDGDQGDTIRFGDQVFGALPLPATVFRVTYRVGGAGIGNVARDTVTELGDAARALVDAATNPFAASGGADEESAAAIRRDAPQDFRATQFRAVRREDYEAAAMRLPWVSQAGTAFRWTGSWLTIFTTTDPKGATRLATPQAIELIDLLNRYRMAGYESYASAPQYLSVDLMITACACPGAFRGDVHRGLLRTLGSRSYPDGSSGFFVPDNFTFGQALEKSALEAAIQSSYGVCGVLQVEMRRRGIDRDFVPLPDSLAVGSDRILRISNNPSRPEEGTIRITVMGGK
jgi:hypothetical protein